MIGTGLPRDLVVAALNFTIRIEIGLVKFAVRILKLGNLRVSQFLKDISSVIPNLVLSPMISCLSQVHLVLNMLVVASIIKFLYLDFLS